MVLTRRQLARARRWLPLWSLVLVLMSLTRIISDADKFTASTTVGTAVRLTIPILMAGMAGLYAERSGIVNITDK